MTMSYDHFARLSRLCVVDENGATDVIDLRHYSFHTFLGNGATVRIDFWDGNYVYIPACEFNRIRHGIEH